jgi:hypothetical protein
MAVLALTRVPGERRTYALEGAGRIALHGPFRRSATAEGADGTRWELARRGFGQRAEATDAAGATAATYAPRGLLRRGGTVTARGRELALRPSSAWRERYALADGNRELATFDGKGWGKRPVEVVLPDGAEWPDPMLLLFTAYVVKGLAEDAAGAAGASAATTASTSASA